MRISLILMAFMIVSVSAFAEDWTCCYIECPEEKGYVHPEYCACYCDDFGNVGNVFVISEGDIIKSDSVRC